MLDGFEISGLDELNTIAAYFLGSGLLVLVIGLAVGITMWNAGRSRGAGSLGDKGLKTAGVAVLGAIVLGGIGGGVQWGSGLGNSELMPTAAQPKDILVRKEAADVTCPKVTNVLNDEGFIDPADDDSALRWTKRLVGPENADDAVLGGTLTSREPSIRAVSWHPKSDAGDCVIANEIVDTCTEVEIERWSSSLPNQRQGSDGTTITESILIEGPSCEDA